MPFTGARDRLDLYEDHLSATRPLMDSKGMPTGRSSTLEFVKRETIGDKVWVHGRQFESEVPNYYTDYFAAVSDQIAKRATARRASCRSCGKFQAAAASKRDRRDRHPMGLVFTRSRSRERGLLSTFELACIMSGPLTSRHMVRSPH
jgi:hypothetical protein